MLKLLPADAWIYDCEFVPDPATCRLVYGLPADLADRGVLEDVWRREREKQAKQGRTPDDRPMVKTSICRIVAISAVKRSERGGKVRLSLKSLPSLDGSELAERDIVDKFLSAAGTLQPQLVGFSSREADLPILLQRATAHALHQPQFCKRPEKPWLGVDYFAKATDWHVDLLDILSNYSRGKQMPSLHEICVASGIPGKFREHGADVAELWLDGQIAEIVRYNQCDVLSQYELYIRVALLAGLITPEQHAVELAALVAMVSELIQPAVGNLLAPAQTHLSDWLSERQRLRRALGIADPAPAAEGVAA